MCVSAHRSVCQDLADARRQEGREEEDIDEGTQPQPCLQRVVRLRRAVRAGPPDEPHHLRHGLRQAGSQRTHRAGRARQQERPDGGEALERDVREEPTAGRTVAPTEGLPLVGSVFVFRGCVVFARSPDAEFARSFVGCVVFARSPDVTFPSSMVIRDVAHCSSSGRWASCGSPVV